MADSWVQKSNFPGTARYGASCFVIGDTAFIGTGSYNNPNDFFYDFWMYIPSSDSWTQLADYLGGLRNHATGFSIGDYGYLGTGLSDGSTTTSDLWKYDKTSNSWSSIADLPGQPRMGVVSFSINNKGYLGTGFDLTNRYNDFYEYYPNTDTWAYLISTGGMPIRHAAIAFTIGCGGYVATGYSTPITLNDLWTILPAATVQNLSVCNGDSIFIGGNWQSTDGTYYDTLTAANGCDSIVTSNLNILSVPTSNQNLSICSGDSVFIGGYWQSTAGAYYDTLTAANGCDSIVTNTLNILSVPTSAQTFSVCSGGSVFIGGNWQSAAGTYYDTLTAANGCDSIITSTLNILSVPTSAQTFSVCSGDSVFIGGNWQSAAGTYYDTLTAANGCDSIVTSTLNILSVPTPAQIFSICNGDSVFIGGNWQNAAGTYYDTLTAANGCDSILTFILSVEVLPVANIISDDLSICYGQSVTLSVFGGNNYLWSTGDTSSSIIISPPVSSTFIVTATNNCGSDIDSILINVFNLPVANAGNDITISTGSIIQLSASGGNIYLWSTGDTSSTITVSPANSTIYTVTVTNENGCSDIDTIAVTIDERFVVFIPTIFSPNGDGNNDKLCVRSQGIKYFEFFIYDRWGEKVFETSDLSIGWDGTYNGKPVNTAVFVYFITGEFINGTPIDQKGNITLVR